jgi:trimethylamine--corrinoid protein Co-methyltransferase
MATGAFQYGRPEQTLLNIAGAQVANSLGAYYGGHGGLSDAKEPGYESAMQKVASAVYNAQFTGNGHIVCGLLAVDEVFSPEQLVLDAEALSWLNRVADGFCADADTIALETIDAVSWGGQYLSEPHTAEHFRQSLWFPQVFSKTAFGRWNNLGRRKERDAAKDRAKALLASAPPMESMISARLEERLWGIIRED